MSVFTNPASAAREARQAYTRAILELLGDRDPLEVLRSTPYRLRGAIAGLSENQLSQPERAGKWAVRHVVRHLADSEIVWGWRLRVVLAQDRPPIAGYDQDAWAERLRYGEASVAEAMDEFRVLRQGHLRLLAAASPADLERVGVHAERGDESVAHMMRLYAGHDLLHLEQVGRIRRAIGA